MELHHALIESERRPYERVFGRVESNGQLLGLVMDDPWFTWLHPLAQLIIRVDEVLTQWDSVAIYETLYLLGDTRQLLRPSEQGDGFARSYYEALQRDPDVVFAHASLKPLLSGASH
jgi:hypothetical protein